MSEFRVKCRSIQFQQYSETHSSVSTHFDMGGENSNTVVTASHHPKSAPGDENPCHEFYNLSVSHTAEVRVPHTDRREHVSDEVSMFLRREDIERIHFATGEMLAQSEGLEQGAASVRIVCDPREEAKTAEEVA
jgi:hypothetical protein